MAPVPHSNQFVQVARTLPSNPVQPESQRAVLPRHKALHCGSLWRHNPANVQPVLAPPSDARNFDRKSYLGCSHPQPTANPELQRTPQARHEERAITAVKFHPYPKADSWAYPPVLWFLYHATTYTTPFPPDHRHGGPTTTNQLYLGFFQTHHTAPLEPPAQRPARCSPHPQIQPISTHPTPHTEPDNAVANARHWVITGD